MLFSYITKGVLFAAVAAIKLYQAIVSPYLPSCCRFSPSCSYFAARVLVRYGLKRAVCLVGVRLLKCQPFYKEARERNINE